MRISIPDKQLLSRIKDSDVPVPFYYRPGIRYFYLKRLGMVLDLMGKANFDRLIEVGYGTGVFFTELARRTRELHGTDIKDNTAAVTDMFRESGIDVRLTTGSILGLPYGNGMFDGLVCISVLEHIKDLPAAVGELARVVSGDGTLYIGFPAKNRWMNAFFRAAGFDPDEIHPSSHGQILAELRRQMDIEETKAFSFIFPLYYVCRCRKKTHA